MGVGEGDAAWVAVGHGGFDDVVEEIVHCAVLGLGGLVDGHFRVASPERYLPSSLNSQTMSGNANSLG